MIEAIKFWNEPNNLSHWDFQIDPEWKEFTQLTRLAAEAVRRLCPDLRLVLGGNCATRVLSLPPFPHPLKVTLRNKILWEVGCAEGLQGRGRDSFRVN